MRSSPLAGVALVSSLVLLLAPARALAQAAADAGALSVDFEAERPRDRTVWIDEVLRCDSPCNVALSPGAHRLRSDDARRSALTLRVDVPTVPARVRFWMPDLGLRTTGVVLLTVGSLHFGAASALLLVGVLGGGPILALFGLYLALPIAGVGLAPLIAGLLAYDYARGGAVIQARDPNPRPRLHVLPGGFAVEF